jgi:hypothetical protein
MDANTFDLANGNLVIKYAAQGSAGQPVLTYEGPEGNKTFRTADIRIVQAELGHLVTVTLNKAIDLGTEMLTLLVPTVTVADSSAPVTTEALRRWWGQALL